MYLYKPTTLTFYQIKTKKHAIFLLFNIYIATGGDYMGMPNVPDIKPEIRIDKKDVLNLLLLSIAFEELGLAHIINGEGEKLQYGLKYACRLNDLYELDESVNNVLKTILKKEMLLQFKFEEIVEFFKKFRHDHD